MQLYVDIKEHQTMMAKLLTMVLILKIVKIMTILLDNVNDKRDH